MNYIGKFISNFKEFYNEINSATLTGAIDVIVVKQPDGTYACSPFHVRFGKMGVLRSKEKIVDIEVNGEPVDIHMKLGDTGEAFFVEEVENEDDQLSVPSHLATSPLPSQLHDCGIDYIADQLEKMKIESGQGSISGKTGDLLSPFSKGDARAFLAGGDNSEIINTTISPIKREAASCDPRGARSSSDSSLDEESVFMPEHKETNYLNLEGQQISRSQQAPTKLLTSTSSTPTIALKSVALQTSGLIGNEKESIEELVATKTFQQAATTPTQSSTVPSSTKKRRRKKSTMKKFAANNKPFSSKDDFNVKSQLTTTTHENEEVFVMDDDDTEVSSFGIEEAKSINKPLPRSASVPSTSLSNIVKIPANTFKQQMLSSVLSDIHPYSDGEVDQSSTGSAKSKRPSSPLSDTEYENSRHDATCQTGGEHIEWSWGEFPRSNTPSSNTNSNSNNQNMSQHSREFIESAANSLKTASNDSNTRNRGLNASETNKLFGVLKFMKKEDTLKNSKEVSKEEGVFLDDLNGMDPEKAGLYLSSGKSGYSVKRSSLDDTESGNGSSLSQSPPLTSSGPTSQDSDSDHDARAGGGGDGDGGLANKSKSELKLLDRYFRTIAISACGGLEDDTISSERFEQSFISFDDFCANPVEKLQNPALVVRIDGKYYNWQAAAPLILSIILYRRSLPIHCIDALMDKTMPKKQQLKQQQQNQQESRGSWWSSWTRSTSSVTKFDDNTSSGTLNVSRIEMPDDLEASFTASNQDQQQQEPQTELSSPEQEENSIEITIESDRRDENFLASSELEDCQDIIIKKSVRGHRRKNSTFQYKKVLRISSRQIEGLNLQEGRNEVVFSVTTAYQGTTRCKCHIYLWNHDDKIIVSDIDGTITKSDILGHILPVIGKDWAQSGVANLFNKIQDNGYKLLYLSARAIGQARITRDYLRSVRQGDICLPDGPLLLSPTSLISALHREVIEKKPEEFKIKCLRDIQCLFPTNPFYAGFGNKINDTWAYRAINIPSSRIFTINHRGELRLGLILSWHSSYNRLSDLVDQMFPPLHKSQDPKSSDFLSEYSSFNYWRDPVPEISQVEPQESKNEPQNR